jgi:hypothetical protein
MTQELYMSNLSILIRRNGTAIIIGLVCSLGSVTTHAQNSDSVVVEKNVPTSEKSSIAASASLPVFIIEHYGTPPAIPEGPFDEDLLIAVNTAFGEDLRSVGWGLGQTAAIMKITESGDPRLAWLISDLMRISGSNSLMAYLGESVNQLLNFTVDPENIWGDTTDHLMAWDIPAPPDYLKYKRNLFTIIVPEWEKIFLEGDIDWRHVSWGGVAIDDREFDTTDALCNCIPAADNPAVSDAASADWLDDDDIVFGIEVNGEYRAYPRQIMDVREMVNDTLGGRDLGIPYCTLCGSAQAYFTDRMPEGVKRPVLRTSGLLIRSNKVMFDLNTYSVFDTFRGQAVTGPLAEKKIKLKQASVVTTEWGAWKKAHPETTVLEESLAMGRDFDFRNNRDANGPIFPIGHVDPRLPVQEDVVGVVTAGGTAIAFQVSKAIEVLNKGDEVSYENVRLVLDGSGVRVVDDQGKDLGSHQSFWFAWSQFYPNTQLWSF